MRLSFRFSEGKTGISCNLSYEISAPVLSMRRTEWFGRLTISPVEVSEYSREDRGAGGKYDRTLEMRT